MSIFGHDKDKITEESKKDQCDEDAESKGLGNECYQKDQAARDNCHVYATSRDWTPVHTAAKLSNEQQHTCDDPGKCFCTHNVNQLYKLEHRLNCSIALLLQGRLHWSFSKVLPGSGLQWWSRYASCSSARPHWQPPHLAAHQHLSPVPPLCSQCCADTTMLILCPEQLGSSHAD